MSQTHYRLLKKKPKGKIEIEKQCLDGFHVTPKNKIPYDGIMVNEMTVIQPSFIEKVVKKKIKRKLDSYMQYILFILEDSDNDGGIEVALNDLERLKATIRNKYKKYLDQKYLELLMKKIKLLERELKIKQYYFEQETLEEEEVKKR